jgi:hypothetical protein
MKKTSPKKAPAGDNRKRPGVPLRMNDATKEVLIKAMKKANHEYLATWIMVTMRAEAKKLLGEDCFDDVDQE